MIFGRIASHRPDEPRPARTAARAVTTRRAAGILGVDRRSVKQGGRGRTIHRGDAENAENAENAEKREEETAHE